MAGATAENSTTDSKQTETIAQWLAGQTEQDRQAISNWQEQTTTPEAIETLKKILRRYPPHTRLRTLSIWIGGGLVFIQLAFYWMMIGVSLAMAWGNPLPVIPFILALLVPIHFMMLRWRRRQPISRKAALLLARYNDPQAVLYLLDCWREAVWRKQDREDIVAELTRLLTDFIAVGAHRGVAEELRALLRDHLLNKSAKKGDLTDEETDLFLTMVRYLSEVDSPTDRLLLVQLAGERTSLPNRQLVVETAALCIEERKNQDSSAASPTGALQEDSLLDELLVPPLSAQIVPNYSTEVRAETETQSVPQTVQQTVSNQ